MTSATASWLRTADWADVSFVLIFEGYNLAYVSHDDVAGLSTAWTNATAGTGPWSNFKGGLDIVGVIGAEFQIFNAQLNPSSLSFTITDADDTLIGAMFADSSSSVTVAHLSTSIDADDTVIAAVEGFGSFSAAPTVYIGTEEISALKFSQVDGYGSSTSYLTTGANGRGIRSLFGTSRNSTFGQAHNVDEATDDRPEITTAPRRWINRNVGLYLCHRVNGSWSAGLPGSSTNDAELLWTGRIKAYRDLGDGRIQLDCIDVLDRLKTTLGSTPFQGTLQEGLRLANAFVEFKTAARLFQPGGSVITDYNSNTVGQWAVSTVYTLAHPEIATAINIALNGRFGSGSTYGPAGLSVVLVRNSAGHYELRATLDGLAATDSLRVEVWLSPTIWEVLGWPRGTGGELTHTSINSLVEGRAVVIPVGDETAANTAPNLPLKHAATGQVYLGSQDLQIVVENVVNGTSYWPQSDSVPLGQLGSWLSTSIDGFLQVGKMIFAVSQLTDTSFAFLGDVTAAFSGGASDFKSVLNNVYDDGGNPEQVQVRQVWIEAGTIGEIFLRLLVSTGTIGYNHPTYDVYPSWMSAGIPWQLIDWQSVLGMGTDPYLLVVTQPTLLLTLLERALNFVGKNLVFANGKLTVVTVGEAAQGSSTIIALTEANKARSVRDGGAKQSVTERTTCDRNPDGIINRVTLRYGLDLNGTFQRTLTVNAVSAQSDNAGQVKSISIDANGIYEDFALLPGGSTLTWEQNVAATALSYFSKAIAVAERSYDFSLATQLYPGARVSITDNYLVDPTTGTRGVASLLGWVVSTSFDWSTGVGRVRVVFSPTRATTRLGMWAPSAMVDKDYGTINTGYGTGTQDGLTVDSATVLLYKFNETSVPGTGYATAVDAAASGGTARNLAEANTSGGTYSINYTHIINGPNGSRYARWFPGVAGNNLTRAGDASSLAVFQGSWTFEAWVRPDDIAGSSGAEFFSYAAPGETQAANAQCFLYYTVAGQIEIILEHGAGVNAVATSTGTALVSGIWHHIGVVCDNSGATSSISFYVDGVFRNTVTGLIKADGGSSARWGFAASAAGSTWVGAIKDVRISNIARSGSAIAADAALTTYQHAIDANTFALWRFNEAPDAIDESTYGYHVRKVAGSITLEPPLAPDLIKARHLDSSTEYNGHRGYETFRQLLIGSWTFDCWLKMDSGYESADRGLWVYGDPGPETLATNFTSIDILGTTRYLRVWAEHGAGVDADSVFTSSGALFPVTSDGLTKHHLAVTHYAYAGAHNFEVYLDGVLQYSGSCVGGMDGGTSSWLRIGSGWSVAADPFKGIVDDMRWSNVRRTASEIAGTYNGGFGSGYNPNTKQLRLLPHAYSADADPVDASFFAVGDKVHVVEVSPPTPTSGLSWSDTIAAVDAANNLVTLTTGLSGFDITKQYALEYDAVTTVVTAQRAKDFIADASTRSTGYAANDAYVWTGDPETTPEEVYIYTQRYRKISSYSDDTGSAASVHKFHDLSRWAQTAAIYHTAPIYINQMLTQAVSYGSASTKRMVFGPVYVPNYGPGRRLEVRLLAASTGAAATVSWRTILSAQMPTGNGHADFEDSTFVDVSSASRNWVSLTTDSATYSWLTGYIEIPGAHPGNPGGSWFVVEASADGGGGTASLKHVYLAEYIENPQTPDVRQETAFLPTSNGTQAVMAARRRFAEAPYAAGRRRGLP